MFDHMSGELGFTVNPGDTIVVLLTLLFCLVLPVLLLVWALTTITTNNHVDRTQKLVWVVVCIALPVIGPLAWLLAGRAMAGTANNVTHASPLMGVPAHAASVHARTLQVHTANLSPDTSEVVVIITVDDSAFAHLTSIEAPLTLNGPDNTRPVTFATGVNGGSPTLDPNQGWIIPVTESTRRELHALPSGPGEHELTTIHVAFIVGS